MKKEITIEELEDIENLEEPVILKRKNKKDLIIVSREKFEAERINNIENVLMENTEKYGTIISTKPLINIQEIETAVNQYGEIVISKNSKNNVIIMSMEKYNKKIMREDIIKKLKKSEEEIRQGEGLEADMVFRELRKKYGY